MRRFYAPAEQFEDDIVTLSRDETRHLRDVLRLKTSDEARIFDGEGREFLAEIVSIGKSAASLRIVGEVEAAAPESTLDLTMVVSVYKSDKLDLVVQKAVELGVARLIPIVTHRSEIDVRDAGKRTDRWRKIALEATKQCERAKVMKVDDPRSLAEFLAAADPDHEALVMFSEKGGAAIPTDLSGKKITALIGPKGGWEDSEIELAEERGFTPIKLGRRIMRAETAAITFAALLQHRFGDLN